MAFRSLVLAKNIRFLHPSLLETNSQNNGCKNLFSALPLCQGKKGGNPSLFKAIENLKNS
jgi:hypothetical protein